MLNAQGDHRLGQLHPRLDNTAHVPDYTGMQNWGYAKPDLR